MSKTVRLKQKQDDWQSRDPITIAGVTHYKTQGNTANWKGIPAAGGKCEVYYDSAAAVIVFDWKGKSTADSTITRSNGTRSCTTYSIGPAFYRT